MFFSSLEFLIFFIVLFWLFFSLPLKTRLPLLVLSSIVFIALFSAAFLIYASIFIVVNYFVANYVAKAPSGRVRKGVYLTGQVFNIGGLVVYKYLGFILGNISFLTGLEFLDSTVFKDIILPLGISYYTFQGISYLYLVYKAGDQPENNFMNFSLYVLFFPKIIAGPIERHRYFLPQLQEKSFKFDYNRVVSGVRLVMWGMFKKIVVGDTMGIVVNKVYDNVDLYQGVPLIIVFLIQPLQIYFDFSGYTDMAMGFARIFGIELTNNFRRPFMSQTVGEFWRRWHISLSAWCNDFIFNRLMLKHRQWGKKAVIYAIFMTFIVIGVWHGANWTFVVLGVLQGIALTYEFYSRKRRIQWRRRYSRRYYRWFSRSIVYLFFSLSLVLFFSHNMGDSIHFFGNLLNIHDIFNTNFGFNVVRWEFFFAMVMAAFVLFVERLLEDRRFSMLLWFFQQRTFYRWMVYFFWMFVVVYFSKNQAYFVYAEF